MAVYTVDLDDTLRHTQEEEYDATRYAFAHWLSHAHETDIEDGIEAQSRWSSDLYPEYGLSRHRFPEACQRAYEELIEESEPYEAAIAREIGRSVFGDQQYYQETGLVDGADETLDRLAEEADDLILLTQGDPVIQERKIKGLGLEEWFDDFRIVEDKADALKDLAEEKNVEKGDIYHIGNSASSDVEAAIEAGVNAIYVPGGDWQNDSTDVLPDLTVLEQLTDLVPYHHSI